MPFAFSCPQGHVLQGDESTIGQPCQCPMCGATFLVPPPIAFGPPQPQPQQPMAWPSGFQQPMAPMPQPQPFQMPMPQPQPFQMPQPMTPLEMPAAAPLSLEAPAPGPQPEPEAAIGGGGGGLVLPFDPHEKEALPFDMPGGNRSGEEHSEFALPNTGPSALDHGLPDPLATSGVPAAAEELTEPEPPKAVHIPCPSGHALKITNDRLGELIACPVCKKKFVPKFENSIEYRERRKKQLRKQDAKAGREWLAWAILAAVIVLALLFVLIFVSR